MLLLPLGILGVIVGSFVAAIVTSGSGSPQTTNLASPSGRNTTFTLRIDPRGGADVFLYLSGASYPRLSDRLRVFSEPRAVSDALPREFLDELSWMADVPDRLIRKSRLLLGDLGAEHMSVYAVPDAKGEVCFDLLPNGSAGCTNGLIDGIDPHVEAGGANGRGLVFGLVANNIATARVLVARRWHDARVKRNAMFYELPAKVVLPQEFVLEETDGTTHTFKVVPCQVNISPIQSPLEAPPAC